MQITTALKLVKVLKHGVILACQTAKYGGATRLAGDDPN